MGVKIKKKNSKLHLKILRSILIGIGLYISLNVYMTILLLGLMAYSIGDLIFASRQLMPAKPLGLSKGFKVLFTGNLVITLIPITMIITQLNAHDWILSIILLITGLIANFSLSFILIRYFKQDANKIQDYIMKRLSKWLKAHFSD